jgi:small-conductance mechanosensitive channel
LVLYAKLRPVIAHSASVFHSWRREPTSPAHRDRSARSLFIARTGMNELLQQLGFLNVPLFTLGQKPITLSSLIIFVLSLLILIWFASAMQRWLTNRLLSRTHMDLSTRETVGTLVRYTVLVFGFMIVMQTIGINLTSLSVIAGALGVGIGFGLQNIFSNFISGLIVMFERPVKIGDRIEVGGFEGDVLSIQARTTTLRTNRGAIVIVPNQKFITEFVKNWDAGLHGGNTTSMTLPIKVTHDADAAAAQKLIEETAAAHSGVLKTPKPMIFLVTADATGYAYELQVWLRGDPVERSNVQSSLLAAIHERLNAAEIKAA